MRFRTLQFGVLMTFGMTAHAQSSVTLYGVIDEGINLSARRPAVDGVVADSSR